VTSPERVLALDGLFNFRDLGGYVGLDGRTTRWRRVFRSDSLHGITDPAAFAALGVRTVVDLRREDEIDRFGRVAPASDLDYRHLPIRHLDWADVDYPDGTAHPRWLADRYLNFAEQGGDGLAATLAVIADADRLPVVVHCMAGKDRTGVVCALTLSLLGVPDEVIAEDYSLSDAGMAALAAWVREQHPDNNDQPHYFRCPTDAMLFFLADLRAKHGSIEGYATDIGLTDQQVAALRDHLLEPA
jgi:protein-tyrosine phosphatase